MAQKSLDPDFAFFNHLWRFYQDNRRTILKAYTGVTRRYIAYNHPDNADSYLRKPQFEALEMYVFLKEFMGNAHVHTVFDNWSKKEGRFDGRADTENEGKQPTLFDQKTIFDYAPIIKQMRQFQRGYPNYIFALTMGTGKTILMATCIFYEFILANKYPEDERYCHNAIIFAPDKTVLQALREIETFDRSKVVPPRYAKWLDANLRMHFLEQAGVTLDVIDGSRFNLIVSNTQKIIRKRQHKEKGAVEQLFTPSKPVYESQTVYDEFSELFDVEPEDEQGLTTNQRFQKLQRIGQLGIYIDEAHHAFGKNLAKDVGAAVDKRKTSLRNTIDLLARDLKRRGTQIVACYNYTGTPYVGKEVMPEVVYAYGLDEAIKAGYLKQVTINGYENTKSAEFIGLAIDDFLDHNDLDARHEGMRPKMAFFAATIKELQEELRPAVETALARHGISNDRILVNVGDTKITTNDDEREFRLLDTPQSEKQFILLVNKGREGWNCRSLFGVALFRKPRSKIFVLQATMRCLRAIGDVQNTGRVYLSDENLSILEDELQQNFRVSATDIQQSGKKGLPIRVKIETPPPKIKLKRVRRLYELQEKDIEPGTRLGLEEIDREKYRLLRTTQKGLQGRAAVKHTEDISHLKVQQEFTPLMLTAEIARYLNRSPLFVDELLRSTAEGIDGVVNAVNAVNEILYEELIPKLFHLIYDVSTYEKQEAYEVELVKTPSGGYYRVTANDKTVHSKAYGEVDFDLPTPTQKDIDALQIETVDAAESARSFHLSTYVFDSNPEQQLFWRLLRDGRIQKLYFTGMLTHGQSDFYVQYIDPTSHTIRSYYPDFMFQHNDGTWVIVEVKGENKLDDPVVIAKKEYASSMAGASGMTYRVIAGKDADAGRIEALFN